MERPLKRPEDFARSLGREVLVRLYVAKDGAREFIGPLTGHDGQTLTLEGHPPFPVKEVALARLYVRW
ncbi:MAG: hypothetical protein LBT60_05030 [Oscillospiraceae bacterium]|nr:hypothetical protein [Oscillospiraceae bacterium]